MVLAGVAGVTALVLLVPNSPETTSSVGQPALASSSPVQTASEPAKPSTEPAPIVVAAQARRAEKRAKAEASAKAEQAAKTKAEAQASAKAKAKAKAEAKARASAKAQAAEKAQASAKAKAKREAKAKTQKRRFAEAPIKPQARDFANCTELNAVYPHGVGQPGAVDSTSGIPVTTFRADSALYEANSESDRDKDGIACEKR